MNNDIIKSGNDFIVAGSKVRFMSPDASGELVEREGILKDVINGIAVVELGKDWPFHVKYDELIRG